MHVTGHEPGPGRAVPLARPRCVLRNGAWLRLVIGAGQAPALPFEAAGPLEWQPDPNLQLHEFGHRLQLVERGAIVVAGHVAPDRFALSLEIDGSDVLGFGAATGGWTRNHSRFRVMPLDTMIYAIPGSSYTAMPFFIVHRGADSLGVVVATSYPLDVTTRQDTVDIEAACDTDGAPVDLLVRHGTLADIVRDLARLTGHAFLPPAWALGYHQSRWSYRSSRKVLEVARRLREHELPADAIHLDIDYMQRYRVFTFHPRRFAQPARLHAMLDRLGLRTMAIVDPGVSVADYHAYRELSQRQLLLKRRDGRPYVGRVWPGATVFPDFLQPAARTAWAELHEPLVTAGVGGIWNDMNDPVVKAGEYYDPLAEDLWHGSVPHRRVRSLYANGMAEATAQSLATARPGQRPFVLSRSGFLGIQRHAGVWTGDNHSTWEHLRQNLAMVLNLGLSGVPLSGADVGGFARGPGRLGIFKPRRPPADLFVRWMELGALMPFFRVHNTLFAPSQDPWSFGPDVLRTCREILRRRYRLLPLLYRLALEAHEDGLPIVRPLAMHDDVPRGQGDEQFLLGRDVLAAPVLHPGRTERGVYLPAGSRWIDWHSGAEHAGGGTLQVAAPPGRTPLFVRAGAALFLAEPGRNAPETLQAPIALEIYASSSGDVGGGSLFLDDGETSSSRRLVLDVRVEQDATQLRVEIHRRIARYRPRQAVLELRVPAGRFDRADVDGRPAPLERRRLTHEHRTATVDSLFVPLDVTNVRWRTSQEPNGPQCFISS